MSHLMFERITGVGRIFADQTLLRETTYDLRVERSGSDRVIRGRLDLRGIGEAVVLAGAHELSLQLEDGRRVVFRLTDTGGGIVVSDWRTLQPGTDA